MDFEKVIKRNHKDIAQYFFYEGQDIKDFPDWFETSMQDEETGEVTFTVKGHEFDTSKRKLPVKRIMQLSQVAVFTKANSQSVVEVLEYGEFADKYQRVEE